MDMDPSSFNINGANGDLLKWLWGVLALPLGWLWKETKVLDTKLDKVEEKVNKVELEAAEKFATKVELEQHMIPIKKDLHTISNDLKSLNTLLLTEALEKSRLTPRDK